VAEVVCLKNEEECSTNEVEEGGRLRSEMEDLCWKNEEVEDVHCCGAEQAGLSAEETKTNEEGDEVDSSGEE
jgi:hypothetical protein